MKTIFLVLVLSSAVYTRHLPTPNETLTACGAEIGMSEYQMQTFEILHLDDLENVDHTVKCVTKCRMQKVRTCDEEGIFSPQQMVDNLVHVLQCKNPNQVIIDEALGVLSRCNNLNVIGDSCEKAFWAYECVIINFKPEVERRILSMC